MTKKLYMDWCEQNMIDLEADMAWTAEFETWLDTLANSSPLSEKQMVQLELDFKKGVRHD
jgi:hypothetical protein